MRYRYVVKESTLLWEMQYYCVDFGMFLGMHPYYGGFMHIMG